MILGVPKEQVEGERRVAATPATVKRLCQLGFDVRVEGGAGAAAHFPDSEYEAAGATLLAQGADVCEGAGVVMQIHPPSADRIAQLPSGSVFISLLYPDLDSDTTEALAKQGVSAVALDKIPRISRAQKMDVLSSMANIAGYRAIVEASSLYGGFFSGQITAAGRTPPAKVLVIGAGVAGLAAIAAARSLGAIVRGFDVRPAVKEQVESLGAEFLELKFEDEEGESAGGYAKTMSPAFIEAEMKLFAEQCEEVDIVVTTALIPGKRAPTLVTAAMVASMKPGSVIVDLAAAQGGNVEGTVADKIVEASGVRIVGYTDLTSRLPRHASEFFGTNLVNLLEDLGGAKAFKLDFDDVVVRQAVPVHEGKVRWPPEPEPPAPPPPKLVEKPQPPPPVEKSKVAPSNSSPRKAVGYLAMALGLTALGMVAPTEFLQHLTVFVLACFVGWQMVWAVTAALHTPLMSVTNAISGIILVGGILQAGTGLFDGPAVKPAAVLGMIAILVASINIVGGFLVTQRMLGMFRREG
jgi:NAD(P) transhydrogenase subunit alpha